MKRALFFFNMFNILKILLIPVYIKQTILRNLEHISNANVGLDFKWDALFVMLKTKECLNVWHSHNLLLIAAGDNTRYGVGQFNVFYYLDT